MRFSKARSEAFRICKNEERDDINVCTAETERNQLIHLADEDEWEQWLQQCDDVVTTSSCEGDMEPISQIRSTQVCSSINLIMSGKTSSLCKLPFSERIFTQMMSKLKIHRAIIRAINRNTSCVFSRMTCVLEDKKPNSRSIGTLTYYSHKTVSHTYLAIVYTCRTAESWEDDKALSVTFIPHTLTTNAIWFGCNLEERDIHGHKLTDSAVIIGRLRNFDGEVFHPMMVPTIFAEFERDRHADLVRESNTQFVQRIIDIESRNDAFYGTHQIQRDTRQTMEKGCPPSRTNLLFSHMKGRVGSFLSGKTLSSSCKRIKSNTFAGHSTNSSLQRHLTALTNQRHCTTRAIYLFQRMMNPVQCYGSK